MIVDSSANDRPSHKAFRDSYDAFAEGTGAAAMDLLQSEGFLSKHASVLFLETFTEAQLLHPAHLPAQVNRTEYTVQRYTPSCFFDISTMFHWPELVKRGLPVLSYPDAICRAALTPEAHRTALWRRDRRGAKVIGLTHPGVFVHEVISKLVIAALSHRGSGAQQATLPGRAHGGTAMILAAGGRRPTPPGGAASGGRAIRSGSST